MSSFCQALASVVPTPTTPFGCTTIRIGRSSFRKAAMSRSRSPVPAPAPTRKVTDCVNWQPKTGHFHFNCKCYGNSPGYIEEESQDVAESDIGTMRAPFACSPFDHLGTPRPLDTEIRTAVLRIRQPLAPGTRNSRANFRRASTARGALLGSVSSRPLHDVHYRARWATEQSGS